MRYSILVLETDGSRINTFIEFFGYHKLRITDTVEDACDMLATEMFDYVFLTGWLQQDSSKFNKDSGVDVAQFIATKLGYTPQVIVHTWNEHIGKAIKNFIPEAKLLPYKTEDFFSIKIGY